MIGDLLILAHEKQKTFHKKTAMRDCGKYARVIRIQVSDTFEWTTNILTLINFIFLVSNGPYFPIDNKITHRSRVFDFVFTVKCVS